jgi:hypothetical protein
LALLDSLSPVSSADPGGHERGMMSTGDFAGQLQAERDARQPTGNVKFRAPQPTDISAILASGKVPDAKLKNSLALALQRMAKEGQLKSKDPVADIMARIFPGPGSSIRRSSRRSSTSRTATRSTAALAGAVALRELRVINAPVDDLSGLRTLRALRELRLDGTEVEDPDDDPPSACGMQVCTSDQFCEDLYKGHALDARGRPLDRKKCVPLPDSCKAKPTCACVTKQVASTHCTAEGGHVYINDYPVRRYRTPSR